MEYLSPQGVLLPLVYGTTASPLWLELRGHSAWQATPSWTVYRLPCHRLLPWLRVTFAMVPDAAWPGSDQWPPSTAPATVPVARLVAPVRPTHGVLVLSCPSAALRVCSVLGRLAAVHRCARAVCCVASAVSPATWLLFTGVLARCVLLHVRCPRPLGSCSPVRPLGVLCGVCGVPGHLAPVHRCARSVCCFACAMSWATWLLFTGVPARCVVVRVRCPGPLGSCSPVCLLGVLCYVSFFSPRGLFLCLSLASLFSPACFAFFFGGGGDGWGAAFFVLFVGVGVCRCWCWCGRGCRRGRGSGGCRALGSLCVRRPPGFRFPGRPAGGC